jgi:peptidylprolyl isomerase
VRRFRALASFTLAAALAVATVGCGGDDDDSASEASGASTTVATTGPDGSADSIQTCTEEKSPPTVEVPAEKPTQLVIEDLEPGDGPTAEPGDVLAMHYTGLSFSNGEEFDSSWDSQPITVALGQGGVIPGWEQGLVGMQLCGRRLLVIPPELAYGPEGRDPIAPNETLVFVVDLVAIQKA